MPLPWECVPDIILFGQVSAVSFRVCFRALANMLCQPVTACEYRYIRVRKFGNRNASPPKSTSRTHGEIIKNDCTCSEWGYGLRYCCLVGACLLSLEISSMSSKIALCQARLPPYPTTCCNCLGFYCTTQFPSFFNGSGRQISANDAPRPRTTCWILCFAGYILDCESGDRMPNFREVKVVQYV